MNAYKAGNKIARAIRLMKAAVDVVGLTVDDLDAMASYISKQRSVGPLFNPTYYQRGGFEELDLVTERVNVMRGVLEIQLLPHEQETINDAVRECINAADTAGSLAFFMTSQPGGIESYGTELSGQRQVDIRCPGCFNSIDNCTCGDQ